MISVMVAIEILVSAIVARSGDTAISNIADYSEVRKKSNFYIS